MSKCQHDIDVARVQCHDCARDGYAKLREEPSKPTGGMATGDAVDTMIISMAHYREILLEIQELRQVLKEYYDKHFCMDDDDALVPERCKLCIKADALLPKESK